MDDVDTILPPHGSQRRVRRLVRLTCPGCGIQREIRSDAWRVRKTDYCKPCGERARATLPKGAVRTFLVKCPGCGSERQVRAGDRRKSDYCKPCSVRVRCGLTPGGVAGAGTRLYGIWRGMRGRCGLTSGVTDRNRSIYVDRGIRVCEEWAKSFEPFKRWAEANGYADGLFLDREDNELGYEPGNCRWVTPLESNRNRRTVKMTAVWAAEIRQRLVTGKYGIQRQLADEYGVSAMTISDIKRGKTWPTS